MKLMRGYQVRLLPTKEQEEFLFKIADGYRFVWNWALEINTQRYIEHKKLLSGNELRIELTKYMNTDTGQWIKELPLKCIYQVFQDHFKAFYRFLKYQSDPKHKKFSKRIIMLRHKQNKPLLETDKMFFPKPKKKGKCKITFHASEYVYFKSQTSLFLQKVKDVKVKKSYTEVFPTGRLSKKDIHDPRVVYEHGKWMFKFVLERENQTAQLNDYVIGIDLGIKDLAIATYCDQNDDVKVFKNINKTHRVRRIEKRRKHIERKLSTAYRKNNSYNRTRGITRNIHQLNKLHDKLINIRNNYIHHCTREIINRLPKAIVLEDLNIAGLIKNHCIAKSLMDQKLYEFYRQILYKAEEVGIEIILANRWFPSSKRCSSCGNIKKDLKLSDRIYKCEQCGIIIDRDVNAAKNLEDYYYHLNDK